MSIGSRIRTLRTKNRLTQKELGMKLGFKESTAEVRIAQYETDDRIPRRELLERIAEALDVNAGFLDPDTNTAIGKLQLLFAMEDEIGLCIKKKYGEPVLSLQKQNNSDEGLFLSFLLDQWEEKSNQLRCGEITREEYDQWRYQFPK